MIKRLQRKFVLIAMGSLLAVMVVLVGAINAVNFVQMDRRADRLLEPKGKQSNSAASPLTKGSPSAPFSISHVISVLSSEYHEVTTSFSS